MSMNNEAIVHFVFIVNMHLYMSKYLFFLLICILDAPSWIILEYPTEFP